jgi:hypothetical protein
MAVLPVLDARGHLLELFLFGNPRKKAQNEQCNVHFLSVVPLLNVVRSAHYSQVLGGIKSIWHAKKNLVDDFFG